MEAGENIWCMILRLYVTQWIQWIHRKGQKKRDLLDLEQVILPRLWWAAPMKCWEIRVKLNISWIWTISISTRIFKWFGWSLWRWPKNQCGLGKCVPIFLLIINWTMKNNMLGITARKLWLKLLIKAQLMHLMLKTIDINSRDSNLFYLNLYIKLHKTIMSRSCHVWYHSYVISVRQSNVSWTMWQDFPQTSVKMLNIWRQVLEKLRFFCVGQYGHFGECFCVILPWENSVKKRPSH